jgi:hypothetical protein
MTLATSQTTIDLELGECDRFAFGPGCSGPLKELVNQKVGMTFVTSMTGIDGKNFHCLRPFQFDARLLHFHGLGVAF